MAREDFQEVQQHQYVNTIERIRVTNGPVDVEVIERPATHYYLSGYRSSVNTPGFHNPKRGLLKPNAFEYFHQENRITRRDSRVTKDYPVRAGSFRSTSTGNPTSALSGITGTEYRMRATKTMPSDLDASCRNKLLAKIKSSKVNLAVAGAERVKTADMIAKTAINFANAYRNLRKGNFSKAAEDLGVPAAKRAQSRFNKDYAKRGARAAGSGWLSLDYGWKPLINDIYGGCEAVARAGNQPLIGRVTATEKVITPVDRFTQTNRSGSTESMIWTGQHVVAVKYGVTFSRDSGELHILSELGITNPALVAWELVPFSFVVDWFLPIGSWLETFDATLGLKFHSGYKTLFSTYNGTYTQARTGTYNNSYTDDFWWFAEVEEVFTKRTVLSSFPLPGLPSFKNPVSVGHMTNALALLTQLFKR